MVLWIEDEPRIEHRLRGGDVSKRAAVLGGEQMLVRLEQDATRLEVEDPDRGTWGLALQPSDRPAWLEQAVKHLNAGEFEDLRSLVEAHSQDVADPFHAAALGQLGRAALQEGDWGSAERYLTEAVEANRAAGTPMELVEDGTALAWVLIERGRLADAKSVLEQLPWATDLPGEVAFYHDFYFGLLAKEAGDLRRVLRLLQQATERAERLALDPELTFAQEVLAGQLRRIGRDASFPDPKELPHGCARGVLLNDIAWARLLECEAGPCTPPLAEAREAVSLFREACTSAAGRLNAEINLALALYHAGKGVESQAAIEQARTLDPRPGLRYLVWSLDLEARLALLDGRPRDALDDYEQLSAAATELTAPEARWRAAVGRGRALMALGDPVALSAYEVAERLLEDESQTVPLHEGRDTFVARRERSTREYLAALLDRGEQARAFEVVRRAHARVLRSARIDARLASLSPEIERYLDERTKLEEQQRDIWTLPSSARQELEARRARLREHLLQILDEVSLATTGRGPELSDAKALTSNGTLVLAYHPLNDGWVGFAATANGVSERRLGRIDELPADPASLGRAVIEPFAAQIRDAATVRLLPYGSLWHADVQAFAMAGLPLVTSKPVAFALDLAHAPANQTNSRVALLVGDPHGDLPKAALEVARIARLLDSSWHVEVLVGDAATSAAVRARIGSAGLFHYAGHAVFRGRGGWESELPLADNTSFSIADILALEHVPPSVVLSGCEAAQSTEEAPDAGVGLAHAFLLAGASIVVAPIRPVRDEDAAALMTDLYTEWPRSGDLVAALQRASVELYEKRPQSDWASFRAIVR